MNENLAANVVALICLSQFLSEAQLEFSRQYVKRQTKSPLYFYKLS